MMSLTRKRSGGSFEALVAVISTGICRKKESHVRHLQNFRAFLFIRDQRKEKSEKKSRVKGQGQEVKMEPSKVHELDLHTKKLSIIEGVDKVRPQLFYLCV